jgi:tetratricopeptide (TPR) repeat protein/TolB-like protein
MGRPIDFRSDQFSCGAILYEMATGRPAFRRSSAVQTMAAIIEDEPEPISALNPAVPPPLRWIIERCLSKDPAARYVSTTDMARDLATMLEKLEEVSSGARLAAPEPWPSARRLARMRAALVGAGVLICALGLALGWAVLGRPSPDGTASVPPRTGSPRRSVAVLGFKNLSGQPEAAWLSTALAEMLTTELAAGGRLRTIPGENIARMKIELSLPEVESLAPDTLARVGRNVGTDLVLLGSYLRLPGDQVRLDLRIQDVVAGETLAAMAENGTETGLVDLVTRTGSRLRQSIGVDAPPAAEANVLAAGLPSNLEAQRFYAEGLSRLRVFDALGARDLLQKAVTADPTSPLARVALAEAWTTLGYDVKAREEARKGFDLSGDLSREERLSVEGRFRESAGEWDKAIEIHSALLAFFPDNVEYGLRLATAQNAGGRGAEALSTLQRLRNLGPPASNDPRLDLTEAAVAQSLGDFKRQEAAAARAVARGREQGARLLVARALLRQAYALDRLGEVPRVIAVAEEARSIYAEAQDRGGLSGALNLIGSVSWYHGDIQAAKRTWLECLRIRREVGYRSGVAASLHNMGLVLWEEGELSAARRSMEDGLAIDRELGDQPAIAVDLEHIAGLLDDMGDLARARSVGDQAVALARAIGDRTEAALATMRLAKVSHHAGDLVTAKRAYHEILPGLRERGTRDAVADVHFHLAEVLLAEGDLAAARNNHQQALDIRTQLKASLGMARSEAALARLSLEDGSPDVAESRLRSALRVFDVQKIRDGQAWARGVLARALLERQRPADAVKVAQEALAIAQRSENPAVRLAVAAAILPALAGEQGRDARRHLPRALAEARELGLVAVAFDLRLATLEAQMLPRPAAASSQARAEASALSAEARARGFGLVAGKARRFSGAGPGAASPPRESRP